MGTALERRLKPETAGPESPESGGEKMDIAVVFTSPKPSLAALQYAHGIADRADGEVTLIVPQIVPYPLPMNSPPVPIGWNERRFRRMAEAARGNVTVRFCFCRDREDTLKRFLDRHSLVVLGCRRRWWRLAAEKRLAGRLRRYGHEVVVVETE